MTDAEIHRRLRILGISAPCDADVVRRARRTKSKQLHPDMAGIGHADASLEEMKRVNSAADDLLEICARQGKVRLAGERERVTHRPRSRDQQYGFYRAEWQREAEERQRRRANAHEREERRRDAENERRRREYEAYRARRRRAASSDESRQREHERAQAAHRRAQLRLETLRGALREKGLIWEESRSRLDAAARAFVAEPASDSALWRLYGALMVCFSVGGDYREALAGLNAAWSRNGNALAAAGLVDSEAWQSHLDQARKNALATRRVRPTVAVEISDSLVAALAAADHRMVEETSPASRRVLGAVLEIRRVLGRDDERDRSIADYWTADDDALLNLKMGRIKLVTDKGYAFIEPYGDDKDVFLHASALEPGGFNTLTAGTVLTFRVARDAKGERATDVEVVASGGA